MSKGNTTSRVMNETGAAEALAALADRSSLTGYLESVGLTTVDDNPVHLAGAIIKAEGVTTQGHFAAVVINFTHGEGRTLVADELTDALRRAFPDANIGKRHGPHYMCHARRGHLKGLRDDLAPIPFVKRAKKDAAKTAEKTESTEKVEAAKTAPEDNTVGFLVENYSRRELQIRAKDLGVSAGGKTEAIAQRIADAVAKDGEMVA